jgi:hypothetical protein
MLNCLFTNYKVAASPKMLCYIDDCIEPARTVVVSNV